MDLKIFTEQELVSDVRSKVRPCYMLYGKDVATLSEFVRKLTAKLVPKDAADLNYHFFPSGGFDLAELSNAVEALPVFSDRVVASVNDLDCDKMTSSEIKNLKEIISEIDPETTTVIFYSTAADLCGGKKNLTSANRSLAEHISKCGGAVCEFRFKKPSELVGYIRKSVQKEGAEISDEAAKMLAERCLSDLLMIKSEIAKLSAYRAGGEITKEDVCDLVSGQIEADAYRLAREISEGRKNEAFATIDRLYSLQKETPAILAAVSGSFTDLYRAKIALISGRGDRDVATSFNYKGREFAIRNALRDCSGIPIERLRNCISILADCDIGIKSLRTDDRILFEEAVARMISGEKASAPAGLSLPRSARQ